MSEEERKKLPKRRFAVTINLQADSEEEVDNALSNIRYNWCRGTRATVSGGCSSGWHIAVEDNPEMTAERHREELMRYVNSDKEGEGDE